MNWIPLLSTLLHYFDGNVSRHSSLLSPRSLRICLITYCHKRGSREQQLQIVIAIDPLLNFCRDWAPGKIYLGMFRQDNENGVHLGSFKARYELLYLFPLLRGLTVPLKGIPEVLAWRQRHLVVNSFLTIVLSPVFRMVSMLTRIPSMMLQASVRMINAMTVQMT